MEQIGEDEEEGEEEEMQQAKEGNLGDIECRRILIFKEQTPMLLSHE